MTAVIVASATAGVATAVATFFLLRSPDPRRLRSNYAGQLVPAVLGIALLLGIAVSVLPVVLVTPAADLPNAWFVGASALMLMGAIGVLDDTRAGRERGFREHLGAALRRRPTTGLIKLMVGVGLAAVLALILGGSWFRIAAAALLIATSTNLWNALDVRPGRALKWAAVALVGAVAGLWGSPLASIPGAALAGGVVLLPLDLSERGMLGDSGANMLGAVLGAGAVLALGIGARVALVVVLAGLTLASERWSFSSAIDRIAPLRWLDRLGRIRGGR